MNEELYTDDGIQIRKKPKGRPPGKKFPERKKKKKDDPLKIDFVETLDPVESDPIDLDLDKLTSEELSDETKKVQIRHKIAQAEKIEKENSVRDGLLVARKESIETMKHLCSSAVEILDLVPDQLGPNLYKKTKKQIRSNLVKHMDMIKKRFIQKIMELEEPQEEGKKEDQNETI